MRNFVTFLVLASAFLTSVSGVSEAKNQKTPPDPLPSCDAGEEGWRKLNGISKDSMLPAEKYEELNQWLAKCAQEAPMVAQQVKENQKAAKQIKVILNSNEFKVLLSKTNVGEFLGIEYTDTARSANGPVNYNVSFRKDSGEVCSYQAQVGLIDDKFINLSPTCL